MAYNILVHSLKIIPLDLPSGAIQNVQCRCFPLSLQVRCMTFGIQSLGDSHLIKAIMRHFPYEIRAKHDLLLAEISTRGKGFSIFVKFQTFRARTCLGHADTKK